MALPLAALIPVVGDLINKIIPDPQAQAEAKLKMFELVQKGELQVMEAEKEVALAQAAINQEDAKSQSWVQRNWRPAVGWTCVGGLFYTYILRPLLPWTVSVLGFEVPPLPPLDMTELMVLLGGMLGLSGFRTFERIKGKA